MKHLASLAAIAAFALVSGGHQARAQAQGQRLVLPSTLVVEGQAETAPRAAAGEIARRLGEGGARLMTGKRARTLFEQRGSTAPLNVSHTDLDALARDTQMALYHVASGLPGRARKDVERALSRADKVLESLNRESLAAQQLLDACLYLVRAHLQKRERKRAREQALECRRLVPDIEPDGTMHPPDVIGILAEAEAELRHTQPGSLRVESEPAGCAVFVNGRQLGTAPLELPHLSPGEYRLQAECDEGAAGRVHRVTIGSTRVVKRIDTRFDAAVQTTLEIGLRYSTANQQRENAHRNAVEVGRVVGAEEVWLTLQVPPEGAGGRVVQVHRIRVRDGELLAAVRVPIGDDDSLASAPLSAAMKDLHEGRSRDHTEPAPRALGDTSAVAAVAAPGEAVEEGDVAGDAGATLAAVESASEPEGGWSPGTPGLVLGIAGGVTLLTSWGLYAYHLDLELTYSDQKRAGASPQELQATIDDLESFDLIPSIVSLGGGLLVSASLPWLLPPEPAPPVWAWVVGGVGGGLAIAGAALLIRGSQCDSFDPQGRCRFIESNTRLGGLLATAAVPMIAVPVIYFLRPGDEGGDTSLALLPTPNADGAMLSWGGQL